MELTKEEAADYESRLVVAGSRSFNDYSLFSLLLLSWIDRFDRKKLVIITGSASRGADNMVIRFCVENDIAFVRYPAHWTSKSAGYIRNTEMAKACTHVIVFWDLLSKGTKHMLEIAKKYERPFFIVFVQPDVAVQKVLGGKLPSHRFQGPNYGW